MSNNPKLTYNKMTTKEWKHFKAESKAAPTGWRFRCHAQATVDRHGLVVWT